MSDRRYTKKDAMGRKVSLPQSRRTNTTGEPVRRVGTSRFGRVRPTPQPLPTGARIEPLPSQPGNPQRLYSVTAGNAQQMAEGIMSIPTVMEKMNRLGITRGEMTQNITEVGLAQISGENTNRFPQCEPSFTGNCNGSGVCIGAGCLSGCRTNGLSYQYNTGTFFDPFGEPGGTGIGTSGPGGSMWMAQISATYNPSTGVGGFSCGVGVVF